ncbi:hypothetical protein DYB32_001949 [Aphanomyces invadans]|uniref:Pre-mRNA-splicing factor SLU7 n=1 Tax=Aphanomyces invadans TaxID=157072 RepID=A0A3R6VR35_9STRA|nr:hypothetical protein DYB32_001949 [Aphanomyces invadans]
MIITSRNLRIRDVTAKYLRNLYPHSAFYDPKTRLMRDNPNPDLNVDEVTFPGENILHCSGDAIMLAKTKLFAWEATEKGMTQDGELHPQATPPLSSCASTKRKSSNWNRSHRDLERHVIRRVPAHPLRSQSAALRRYPWETPRETSEVFQWDHESPLDPVASLKQRRWTPADNTTTNSSVARSSSSTASTALQKSMQYYSAPHIVDRGSTPNADSPTASGNGANEEALWRISRTSEMPSRLPDVPTMAILIMQKRALEVDVERLQAKLADYRAAAARECRARRRLRRRSKARRGHITAANGYVDQGEYFYAQLELKKALALDDKCWATWHALAECLLKCHWPNEAALACQVSLELARTPVAVALLGRIRLRQQRLSEAIACFHEALE